MSCRRSPPQAQPVQPPPKDLEVERLRAEVSETQALLRQLISQGASVKPKRKKDEDPYIKYLPFEGDAPTRRVVLAWRRSFTRYEAIAALRNAVYACELPGVKRLS